jgi:hypothetical protein
VNARQGSLPTPGGSPVDIVGTDLGLSPSVVSVTYSGGSTGLPTRRYDIPSGNCTILTPGAHLLCPSLPGVGANYTFVVTVDGIPSAPSTDVLSYARPVISSVDGVGATFGPTRGGATVLLHGDSFGPAGDTVVSAWAVPLANSSLEFHTDGCTVSVAHVTIQCTTPVSAGALLSWHVTVEGQKNAVPVSTVAPPSVSSVRLADPGGRYANTTGGSVVAVSGDNFGADVGFVSVAFAFEASPGPRVSVPTSNCTLVIPHTELQCALPTGVGVFSAVIVTVLGQSVQAAVTGLAYAPPTISGAVPARWPVAMGGATLTLVGTGFGSPAQSPLVRVSVTGVGGCAGDRPVVLAGQQVTVRNDNELTLQLPSPAHVVASWIVNVTVAGQLQQGPSDFVVHTRAPATPMLSLGAVPNDTHVELVLVGADFGPALATEACPGDAVVQVAGASCGSLRLFPVRACPPHTHDGDSLLAQPCRDPQSVPEPNEGCTIGRLMFAQCGVQCRTFPHRDGNGHMMINLLLGFFLMHSGG